MQKTPKVSVIIPVYNVEKYLAKCLDSIINQTLQDIEIICVDDGSTDHSIDILTAYAQKDERISVICKENGGQSSARNLGLQYAKGTYVYFIDGDDILTLNALEELTEIAERKQLDILCFDSVPFFEPKELEREYHSWIDRSKRSKEYSGVVSGRELFAEMLSRKDYRASSARSLYRRMYLREKGLAFYEGIIHEDELFTAISMLEASAVSHVRKTYYQRRISEGSTMTSPPSYKNFKGYFVVYTELMRYAFEHQFEYRVQMQLWNQIISLRNCAFARYVELPKSEKKGVTWTNDPNVQALFKMNIDLEEKKKQLEGTRTQLEGTRTQLEGTRTQLEGTRAQLERTRAQLEKTKNQLNEVKCKIERIKKNPAIWLCLKIRGGIRCIKENGLPYTLRRFGQKTKGFVFRRLKKADK